MFGLGLNISIIFYYFLFVLQFGGMKKICQPHKQQNLTLSPSKINIGSYVIKYKEGHQKLPILILPNHDLLVYTQCAVYPKIAPYIASIAEPLYRPHKIHEYRITKFSLYTAMVLHYSAKEIIQILSKICKNLIFPESLKHYIDQYMKYAGKLKFSLEGDNYYITTLKQIASHLIGSIEYVEEITIKETQGLHLQQINQQLISYNQENQPKSINTQHTLSKQPTNKSQTLYKYKIIKDYFEVTKKMIEQNIPIVQQYDFENDKITPNANLQIINGVVLRYYQQRSIKNVFIEGKGRSGIIILPCGAGKSLVAISIIARIKKNAVIFCESQVSAEQWRAQLMKWTNIDINRIILLSPNWKKNPKSIQNATIFITTYTMVGMKRVVENQYLSASQKMSWGVCIADEVHKLPADTFQNVLKKYKFHLKIGLTATPYRQDKKIDNLFYMIGPKLYEENWLDLVNEGCLAKPYCVEILCQMPQKYTKIYQNLSHSQLIHTGNPNKFRVLQYLIKKHLQCNDKILVFCDRPFILEQYAKRLKYPFIHGDVREEERIQLYNIFKTTNNFNVIFLSRVGDTAIDLPCANVAIQLGMHFKSRRQQVQRMGRIMRAKDNPNNEYNAFFYTLVSMNTKQVSFSRIRQKCLVDQGFQYQIVMESELNYNGMKIEKIDQQAWLNKLLSQHSQGNHFLNLQQIKNIDHKGTQVIIVEKKVEDTIQYIYQGEQL